MNVEEKSTEVGNIVSQTPALDNRFFEVVSREIQTPDGGNREQLVWNREGKEFSVALALTHNESGEECFVLIREPKYGQMENMLTVPAGAIKKDETPETTAKREFKEETGYEAEEWIQLTSTKMVDFPDKVAGGKHHFYFARGAKKVQEPEAFREVILISREEAEQLIDGEHKELELKIAMSFVSLFLGMRHLDKLDKVKEPSV